MYIEDVSEQPEWYVVHTYSGYENKVKTNLEKIIENHNIQDQILEIVVPMMEEIEKREGREKSTFKKVFPGYVLVKMIMTDETWYLVRNTRGVTGFVGPGSKPVPLNENEILSMGVEQVEMVFDFEVGDTVKVTSGPLENFTGVVEEVSLEKEKVKVLVSMFGREVTAELEYSQIQKIF
ncbi:MAG: transcription termination/antitermination protein NusG [Clostridiales bacterium]|jgi:transcriptional antiterminator NusG|nr:transcription termination/antitermination protein NusG [Clostridiales bacterium]